MKPRTDTSLQRRSIDAAHWKWGGFIPFSYSPELSEQMFYDQINAERLGLIGRPKHHGITRRTVATPRDTNNAQCWSEDLFSEVAS